MPALPTTGEMRFSAIRDEFNDINPVTLSHYYKDIEDIATNHIDTFPDSFNEFRLTLFRGKEKEETRYLIKLTANLSSIGDADGRGGGKTFDSIITGAKAVNLTRGVPSGDRGGQGFDNRGTHAIPSLDLPADTNNKTFYPNLILQGAVGDQIELTGESVARETSNDKSNQSWNGIKFIFWLYDGTTWANINESSINPGTATMTFTHTFNIPDMTPGAYALGFSSQYIHGDMSLPYRICSWKSYSFHVWG